MPGREWNATASVNGFNGKRKDDEWSGSRNHYSTEYRQYDPRLGRWMSIDPAATHRADLNPYHFVDNSPIWLVDKIGDVETTYVSVLHKDGTKTTLTIIDETVPVKVSSYMVSVTYFKGTLFETSDYEKRWGYFNTKRNIIYNESTGKWTDSGSQIDKNSMAEGGWRDPFTIYLSKIDLGTGVKVWGSGSEDLGGKNRKILKIDGKEVEIDMSSKDWEALNLVFSKDKGYKGSKNPGKPDPLDKIGKATGESMKKSGEAATTPSDSITYPNSN